MADRPGSPNLRDSLQKSIDTAEWTWLVPHLDRQCLVVVSQELELIDVGEKVAIDEVKTVGNWVAENRLGKPSAAQVESWNANPEKQFAVLIVAPYVLIQELPN